MKKFLTLTLALLSAAVFACQYPELNTASGYMRYIYIAGVNDTDNHIASVTQTSQNWTWEGESGGEATSGVGATQFLNFTCKNNITVDLPLTVYVAATPRTITGSPEGFSVQNPVMKTPDNARLVLHLQYRVLPSTTWITAKTVRLDSWNISAMSTTGKPLFGSYTINPTASYGSTIMIRIYITAEPGASQHPGSTDAYTGVCPTENADPTDTISESLPDSVDCKVAVGEEVAGVGSGSEVKVNNALNLIGISSAILTPDAIQAEIGDTGWTYEQVMTVIVSGKRRPGK